MAEFLHISFYFNGKAKIAELKPEFNKAIDWYRYAPNCWIVCTTTDAEGWDQQTEAPPRWPLFIRRPG